MTRSTRGFTLLEMMVTVAIIAIIASMAAAGFAAIGARGAMLNTSHDFHSMLSRARARAAERGTDVWLLVNTTVTKTGNYCKTGGRGGYFLFEDTDANFGKWRAQGNVHWNNFNPPGNMYPTDNDRLLEAVFLQDAPGCNVVFGTPTGATFEAPFNTLTLTNGCTFCGGNKGAVVFTGEGGVFFIDNAGDRVTSSRMGGFSLTTVRKADADYTYALHGYLFGIVGATAQIRSYKYPR